MGTQNQRSIDQGDGTRARTNQIRAAWRIRRQRKHAIVSAAIRLPVELRISRFTGLSET